MPSAAPPKCPQRQPKQSRQCDLHTVFVSGNGTWTIIATGTDGKSCLLSAGKDWQGQGFVKGLDTAWHPATLQ